MFDFGGTGYYKGFVVTNNKKAVKGWKNGEDHYRYGQVTHLKEYAGVIADNAVLIDADEPGESERLAAIVEGEGLPVLMTDRAGGRGVHVLAFDNDSVVEKRAIKVMLACGVVVDIMPGRRNSYECLQFDGVARGVVYDGGRGELPRYLTPVRRVIDFAGMGEGSGRNDALYSYILTLQEAGFTDDEARECLRILNTYVLGAALSDDVRSSIEKPAKIPSAVN